MSTEILEKKELSPEELKQLRAEVIDKIVVARVGLLLRHPFFGNMATRLQIKECDDSIFETFFEGKVDAYDHCVKLLTQLEDKLRVETIPDGLRQLNEWGEQSI